MRETNRRQRVQRWRSVLHILQSQALCAQNPVEKGLVFPLSPPRLWGATIPSGKDRGLAHWDPRAFTSNAIAETLCPHRLPWDLVGVREPACLWGGPGHALWTSEEGCFDNDEFALKVLSTSQGCLASKKVCNPQKPILWEVVTSVGLIAFIPL